MAAKGYRRLVYLCPKSGVAGDLESEQGFQEAVGTIRAGGIESMVVHHDGSRDGVCARLDAVLARSELPTGFLVARAPHVLAALGHLLRQGLRLPQDAALVSRDDDPFFEFVVPKVTRYATDASQYARKLSRLVLQLADQGAIPTRDYRIMPRFLRGETLP
jgi:DNA-binding LacI/PurR family transcriptional regulator